MNEPEPTPYVRLPVILAGVVPVRGVFENTHKSDDPVSTCTVISVQCVQRQINIKGLKYIYLGRRL